jgi:anthranilate phosphoribosyltransferase
VVHGEPGLDEISPLGLTHIVEIRDGAAREWKLDPAEYGLTASSADELAGGDPADNARIITEILSGRGNAGAKAAVVLNAAAAVYVSGSVSTFGEGVARAKQALESGSGLAALDRLRAAYSR